MQYRGFTDLDCLHDEMTGDGTIRSPGLPIDKLKVHGNQLSQQQQGQQTPHTHRTMAAISSGAIQMSPPGSPHPPTNFATVQANPDSTSSSASAADKPQQASSSSSSMIRRYEFIRRSITRGDKSSSPTFVIEGKKVTHKQNGNGGFTDMIPAPPESLDSLDDNKYDRFDKFDFDAMAFLENRAPMKGSKPPVFSKSKTEGLSGKGSANSVVLPVLHIDGSGVSQQQQRSKSSSIPGDEQPQNDMEDHMATDSAILGSATSTTNGTTESSIWAELENLDQRHHRSIKKNNFFPMATRIDENHTDLCVENSHKPSKTITLQLHTSHEKQKPVSTLFPNGHVHSIKPKTSKSPREKLYRSATQIGGSRPLFHSVNSYLNFNNLSKSKSAGLYSSQQYLDSNRLDNILQPLENMTPRPVTKKLVAKYSDMEIQKELNDFFKIRPVK